MKRAMTTALAIAAAMAIESPSVSAGMIYFTGEFYSVQSALFPYVAGDTISGNFEYDPHTPGTPVNETTYSYRPVVTDFSLTFHSGFSQGKSINGVTNSQILITNDGPNGSSIWDYVRSRIGLPRIDFQPGLQWGDFEFRFTDPDAALVDSMSLADLDADFIFNNHSSIGGYSEDTPGLFQGILSFRDADNNVPYNASFFFTSFTHIPPEDPDDPDDEPSEIPSMTEEVAVSDSPTGEITFFGGSNGSPNSSGGLDVGFETAPETGGIFSATYSQPDLENLADSFLGTDGFEIGNFLATGSDGSYQVWDLDFDGQLGEGGVTLQFEYQDTGLSASVEEDSVGIWHYGQYGPLGERQWKWLQDEIDTTNNIVTITVDHFSPFAVGIQAVPEPSSIALLGIGGVGCLLGYRRRQRLLGGAK